MQAQVIILATPIFFALIFIEWIVGLLRGRNTYRVNDAINSLSLGVLSQISAVFTQALKVGIYAWMVPHIALFTLHANSIWVWLSGLLLYDFCYYWQHRMSHEVTLLWASHVVHHQSEDYNLSTALRQPASDALFVWIFYLPLAVIGYPVQVFAAIALIDLLYQFWVHTQQIGKLGWFDHVFVSPSNHRAHHGVNDIYVDRNYGGILILWDRLFGSFTEEREDQPVVYGTRSPLCSWDPIRANLDVYKAACCNSWRTRRLRDKMRIWIARPGWKPADLATSDAPSTFDVNHPRYDPELSVHRQIYCLLHFGIVLLVTTHFLATQAAMPLPDRIFYALWLASGLWIVGGLLEGRVRFVAFETMRLVATASAVLRTGAWFGPTELPPLAEAGIVFIATASVIALRVVFRNIHASPQRASAR